MAIQGFPAGDIVPIMGMATGIISMVLIAATVIKVSQSQIGHALARRILGKTGPAESEFREELLELRDHVAQLENRLAENEERLDFTERLLSRGKDEVQSHGH